MGRIVKGSSKGNSAEYLMGHPSLVMAHRLAMDTICIASVITCAFIL